MFERWRGQRFLINLDTEGPDIRESGMPEAFVEGDVRVTSPNGAAESAIAINPANTDILIAGSNGPNGGQRMHRSTDVGAEGSYGQRSDGSERPASAAACLPQGIEACD